MSPLLSMSCAFLSLHTVDFLSQHFYRHENFAQLSQCIAFSLTLVSHPQTSHPISSLLTKTDFTEQGVTITYFCVHSLSVWHSCWIHRFGCEIVKADKQTREMSDSAPHRNTSRQENFMSEENRRNIFFWQTLLYFGIEHVLPLSPAPSAFLLKFPWANALGGKMPPAAFHNFALRECHHFITCHIICDGICRRAREEISI